MMSVEPRLPLPDAIPMTLRQAALQALLIVDPVRKVARVRELAQTYGGQATEACFGVLLTLSEPSGIPGRPAEPLLVAPSQVERRAMHTPEGRAALLHALTHIEFNAINLALDAIWRFPGMPCAYYMDWLRVAREEAEHFCLLTNHLKQLGVYYGQFPAHNGLWEMVEKTRDDVLARMALVPRTLEARGLDATPGIRAKLMQAGEKDAAAILDIILRDEIGHVAIGNHWYHWLCQARGLEPIACYDDLAIRYDAPALRGPFNLTARREAGFAEAELMALNAQRQHGAGKGMK